MTKYQFTLIQFYPGERVQLKAINQMGQLGWNMTGCLKHDNGVIEFYFSRPI